MNGWPAFVPDVEASIAVQPGNGALHDPTSTPQAAAVGCAALSQVRTDASLSQNVAMGLGIVRAVALQRVGLTTRAARQTPQRWNGIDQWDQLRDIVTIGGSQDCGEGDAACFGQKVMFRPFLAAIGRVRSSFFPPRSARTDALSMRALAKSSWPRRRSSPRSVACRRCQTPARCHAARRRQQVLPEPQPISVGSICHGSPDRSTKTMPVSAARSSTGGRPPRRPRRRRRLGSSGWIRAHSASSMSCCDMPACTKLRVSVQEGSHEF